MACSSSLNLISWKRDAAGCLASPPNHLGGGYGYGYGPQMVRFISRKENLRRVSHYRKPSIFAGRVGIYRAWPQLADPINIGSSLSTDEVAIANSLKRVSPWLMLPPQRLPATTTNNPEDGEDDGDDMVFKFYSLEENKVLSFTRKAAEFPLQPYENAEFVGCSHGWLALLDNRSGDVFLFNPLSGRHLNLPNINNLSLCTPSLLRDGGRATTIILSRAPPEDENEKEFPKCHAVMLFGGHLAFCRPGHSTEWTHVSSAGSVSDLRPYRSVAYSPSQRLFFCINSEDQLECWDFFPKPSVFEIDTAIDRNLAMLRYGRAFNFPWSLMEGYTRSMKFLVFEQRSDRLFLVDHLVMDRVGPYGLYNFVEDDIVGLDVYEYDYEDREFKYLAMEANALGGLSFFIGVNHGFVLPANHFPEQKPDSIYFAGTRGRDKHDVYIFDYEEGTTLPCYYSYRARDDIDRLLPMCYDAGTLSPSTMWFTPNYKLQKFTPN